MNNTKLLLILGTAACITCGCAKTTAFEDEVLLSKQEDFVNLLNVKNVPLKERHYGAYVFSDMGAWSSYALPENEGYEYCGSFIGPMVMTGRGWIAATLAQPIIKVNEREFDLVRNIQTAKYLPGKLIQEFNNKDIHFTTELCFATNRTAVVRSVIKNVSGQPMHVSLEWVGGVFNKKSQLTAEGNSVSVLHFPDSTVTTTCFRTADKVRLVNTDSLHVCEKNDIVLPADAEYRSEYTQTLMLRREDSAKELAAVRNIDIDKCFAENKVRWDNNIDKLLSRDSEYLSSNKYRKVIVKAMMTLNSNWRSAAGDIYHAGSNPSFNGFLTGIWSWDAWKIASANVLYNPEMAKDEMRTLFDHQAENGMVPDYIGFNKRYNNWRDSKPPVATWGTMNVYRETGDKEFLAEMFDKLYKFHRWWYTDRDHDQNGVCEYGSTDGSLIAAAWESGMDNGVRFDDATMLKNKDYAWSMNQENICLNSFLYAEKNMLAEMADILGKKDLSAQLKTEAEKLKIHIQTKMFDPETGFFYDTRLGTGDFIKVMGAECWLPLWAGAATKEQAKAVMEKMMDEHKFNSTLPLGTLDTSHPALRPTCGYWRGPVWVDQVYFGITGLRNYGYNKEADFLLKKFIDNAQGLTSDGAINENYNPLTGEALCSPNFGWSSACIIKMLLKN